MGILNNLTIVIGFLPFEKKKKKKKKMDTFRYFLFFSLNSRFKWKRGLPVLRGLLCIKVTEEAAWKKEGSSVLRREWK